MARNLDKWLRESIVEKLVAKRYDAEEETFKKEHQQFGDELYAILHKGIEFAIAALPLHFLPLAEKLWIKGEHGNYRTEVPLSSPRPVAAETFQYVVSKEMFKKAHKFDERGRELRDDRRALGRSITATIKNYRTVEALLKAWPEAKEILEPYLDETTMNLPAKRFAELNTELGLP